MNIQQASSFALGPAIAVLIAVLFALHFRQRPERNGKSHASTNSGSKDLALSSQAPSCAHNKVYRLQKIPEGLSHPKIQKLLRDSLALHKNVDIHIKSLAKSPFDDNTSTATVYFSQDINGHLPSNGRSPKKEDEEWRIIVSVGNERLTLILDRHFEGFTPLQKDDECDMDFIAITGLGAHAYGSFSQRGEHYMWIRDSLPKKLRNTRILLYGFNSRMQRSRSVQGIKDIANGFRNALAVIRPEFGSARCNTPLVILGHSLGGVVVKEALINMKDGNEVDKINFKATYGLLFFGVPNQGMDTRGFVPIVGDGPNRYLVEVLRPSSDFLRKQSDEFPKIFKFRDSEIISYYETEQTPTAQKVGHEWKRTGESILLVPFNSADHCRPWENEDRYRVAVGRDHSEMVKFSEVDLVQEGVIQSLNGFRVKAPTVIGKRLLGDGGM